MSPYCSTSCHQKHPGDVQYGLAQVQNSSLSFRHIPRAFIICPIGFCIKQRGRKRKSFSGCFASRLLVCVRVGLLLSLWFYQSSYNNNCPHASNCPCSPACVFSPTCPSSLPVAQGLQGKPVDYTVLLSRADFVC